MTENNTKIAKKNGMSRRIISVVLFVIVAALLASSVMGYAVRGMASTQTILDTMRTDAVLSTATSGLVDSIAAARRLAYSQELRKSKDFRKMGTDAYIAACDQAEAEAREEATALYSDTSGVDTAALEAAIPGIQGIQSQYNTMKEVENETYAALFEEVTASVGDWTDFRDANPDDDAMWSALCAQVEDLSERAHLRPGMLRLVNAMAEAEIAADHAQEVSQLWTSASGAVEDWTAYAEADDEALWAVILEAVPSLAENEKAADYKEELIASAKLAVSGEVQETEEETVATQTEVDYSYIVYSDELQALEEEVNSAFTSIWDVLVSGIPALSELKDKDAAALREQILSVITASEGDFAQQYTKYASCGADKKLAGFTKVKMVTASNAENLLLLGVAMLLMAVLFSFWKPITGKMGVSRSIILLFFVCLMLAAQFYKINMSMLVGNILERVSMYGVLVLAMMPGIQCGISLNMGMTIGCVSGLFALVTALNFNINGWAGLIFSIVVGIIVAIPLGWGYAILLNRMKGSEMTISTYVGYSFVSLMCMVWMGIPYTNPRVVNLLIGRGLRVTHSLLGNFAYALDELGSFKIWGITVPTGGILFFLICCGLMWLFSRSKLGISMSAAGSNPRFAEASGINVDHMRILGTVLSTVLAAVGIVVYSQAFGYAQLYTAPRQLGFIAASAILIGGASVKKAKISHVIIGVILFEGVLSMGQQVANEAVSGGGLSEVMRIMISNGIILYALTQSGGEQK
ncbi:MAG: ABC transporter permease [Faecousia sp.]